MKPIDKGDVCWRKYPHVELMTYKHDGSEMRCWVDARAFTDQDRVETGASLLRQWSRTGRQSTKCNCHRQEGCLKDTPLAVY